MHDGCKQSYLYICDFTESNNACVSWHSQDVKTTKLDL